jgi:hypothetical protein
MLMPNLSRLIRVSFQDELRRSADLPGRTSEPALGPDAWAIVRASRDPRRTRDERGAVVAAAIRCYRRAPTQAWGAVVLELLSPALVATSVRFHYLPIGVSAEDVEQQLMVEALDAARRMRLPARPGLTTARIAERAVRNTALMLLANARAEGEERDEAFLAELAESGADATARLSQALGAPARELAIRMGASLPVLPTSRHPRRPARSLREAA